MPSSLVSAIAATRVQRGRRKHWLREYRNRIDPTARPRGRKLAAIKSKKLQLRATKKLQSE
jgi:hypothetical protein